MKVRNHAAIITGGGSGMGAETARRLAAEGAKVALFDLNVDAVQAVADEIGGIAVQCDVSDAASTEAAFAAAREAHGPARIAISCAGVATPGRIVGREGPLDLAAFKRVVDINLVGTFNVMRLAAYDMSKLDPLETSERGVIINTASVAGFEGQIGQAAYGSSKGGVIALGLPAARELARSGIRVMTIAPGLIATPMLLTMPQEVQDSLAASVPFPNRFGDAGEYADLALHIIGNVMLNGDVIRLDGALRLAPK
ncbi:SDR family NAD(P)-dependent oxidoreductase [Skermanella sp. TT6]|uniref:SDR family NAD(P)-dependent oxidoreductase n=1 Tax=Skermanella cutis TaxID=2775420 RepID=A0ABX7B6B7_9PROT|nr:SDR family NAD(P)-dependent oxidoreductase [Skermanella sp. TT6]QQP89648.1 SDR family NAD(P)-dependent oxidoreductase [Skermanella sp. TT6]